jgi:hypothetical protein
MAEFDKTKKAIGLNSIDDSLRKDMLEKFKSAGGKIVKDKPAAEDQPKKDRPQPKTRQSVTSRTEFDRSSSGSGRGGSSSGSNRSSQSDSKSSSPRATVDSSQAYEKEISSFAAKFAVKLKCWFARVTPFGAPEITPACMGIFARDLRSALMEFQMVGNELLTNSAYSPKITKALDQVNPVFIEVLALGHKLYKNTELGELTDPYNAAPDQPVYINRVKDPIYAIFKKLYVLYPYQESYKKAVSLAYEHLQKLEGKPAMIYNSRKKKILQEVDNLFGTIFEKMYLVIIRNENKNITIVSRYMENMLGITLDDKPGQRKSGEGVPEAEPNNSTESGSGTEEASAEEKEEEKKEEVVIPKEMAYGLRLMKMYNLEALRKKFDPRGELSAIPDSDKALLSYLYFKEFDDNYSFVMTTKKIDIKQVHVNGNRVDYRQKLLDQYETVRGTLDQFRIYTDTFKEYSTHKANPGANYIEASKKTTALETKRSQHSRNVRVIAKEFMEKTRDILLILINDMKSKREIIGNMDDIMSFDNVEAKKRLNKKPVKQCIMESYCFSLALAERLENGDLYGGVVELSPEEMKESFGIEIKDEAKQNEENSKQVDSTIEPSTSNEESESSQSSDSKTESTSEEESEMDSDGFNVEY